MNTLKSPPLDEIGTMVSESIIVVFNTTLRTKIGGVANLLPSEDAMVVGSIGLVGDINGMFYLRLPGPFAKTLASRMLTLPEDMLDDDMVNDVIGEVSNMIVGSVKSQLCDSGLPCALTISSIVRGDHFRVGRTSTAQRRLLNFESEHQPVFLEILLKQAQTNGDLP